MDLSVIIPVYNAAALIDRCLDSVFNQKTRYTFEIILVDDGSTDNSVELIKARKEANIRLFQQRNAGPAAARNKGVELAQGRYCAYLDADDYWIDGFVEKTVAFLDTHEECVAVNVAQRHLTVSGYFELPQCYKVYKESFVLDDFFAFWAEYSHVCTGSVAIRKEVLMKAGGMRLELRANEDWEFWALISLYGKWGFIPQVLFVSDGARVTQDNGWVEKMKPRWYNTKSVEEWQKRIIEEAPDIVNDEGFCIRRGQIASDIAYSLLLSERGEEARQQVLKYHKYFPQDRLSKMMNLFCHFKLLWWILVKLLNYREYNRKV